MNFTILNWNLFKKSLACPVNFVFAKVSDFQKYFIVRKSIPYILIFFISFKIVCYKYQISLIYELELCIHSFCFFPIKYHLLLILFLILKFLLFMLMISKNCWWNFLYFWRTMYFIFVFFTIINFIFKFDVRNIFFLIL